RAASATPREVVRAWSAPASGSAGTPRVRPLARLPRIALARAGDIMIGRSDCAKDFAGQKFRSRFTGTTLFALAIALPKCRMIRDDSCHAAFEIAFPCEGQEIDCKIQSNSRWMLSEMVERFGYESQFWGASAKIVISSMSLADLASLASSVAVVVSLLFLGLQIRQSNRNQRSLMQQGRSARNVELLSRLSDPRVSDVISRAANGETLTDQDCFVLYSYMTSVFWSYEEDFFQFHLGMLDPKSWASDGTVLRRLLGNPAYRAVWRFARGGIGDEYRSFLDGLAAESRHNVPPNLPNTLRQYIAEEREALQRSQDVKP